MAQIVSDTHLEMGPLHVDINPVAPICALLGDIGYPNEQSYTDFIVKMSEKFRYVFIITGNHEYYKEDMDTVHNRITELSKKKKNIYFLNNSYVDIGGVRYIGTTLWSYIPPNKYFAVSKRLVDYTRIKYYKQDPETSEYTGSYQRVNKHANKVHQHQNVHKTLINMSPLDSSKWHQTSLLYINSVMEKSYAEGIKKVVILSHHAPLEQGTSHEQYEGSETNCAFASDLSDWIEKWKEMGLCAWAFGHTHHNCDFNFKGVRICSNPVGYKHELNTFNPEFALNP